ncbi:hypothetical protein ACA910_020171 [Epithemia clementina (nom. ined.)]
MSTSKSDQKQNPSKIDRYNGLMSAMAKTKEELDQNDNDDDDDDDNDRQQKRFLSQAIDMALSQGRGWSPGEKEAYLEKILDDDFIPPMFATSEEELEQSGLQEAFTSLIYDGESPTSLMLQFKKKGHDAFANGKRNEVGNLQYYRDAINHYQEALAWALKIEPMQAGDLAQADTDDPTFTEPELDEQRSLLCSNIALMHWHLRNWGYARNESKRALQYNPRNAKAWYRLAKAYEQLKQWEEAGDALDQGLAVEPNHKEMVKLQQSLAQHVRKARQLRQQRATARAERVAQVKQVWKHCQDEKIQLGRTALVSSVSDDGDDSDDDDHAESKWHQHLPISGVLPRRVPSEQVSGGDWVWPCLFLYPSHQQSDFVKDFGEHEMIAQRMAQMFPELEDDGKTLTSMPWDANNEFVCSQLAVYFEVHNNNDEADKSSSDTTKTSKPPLVHPDDVELLRDQASCMRFYESSRALKGDEGPEMAQVIRALERKHLYQQRKQWKKQYKNLLANHNPNHPVIRVHPGVCLLDVLKHARMVVPNFIVTLYLIPESHPAHASFLNDHPCLDLLQPSQ